MLSLRIELLGVTPIDLDVIDSPRGVSLSVLRLVIETTRTFLASHRAGIGINSQLQALRVNVIGEGLDAVRKADWIGDDRPIRIAADLPAVVDVHVLIAGLFHSTRCNSVHNFFDELLAHIAAKLVPTVPPHRGRSRKPVVNKRGARASTRNENDDARG